MAVGLRVRDPDTGQELITLTTHLTKVLGTFNTGTSDGAIADGNLANGTPFFATMPSGDASSGSIPPTIVASSTGITWSWPSGIGSGYRRSVDVTYGFWT
ncbi:hypothetical protein SAMN02800692_1503 [Luteibacter sp. UNC138MFCol5.1]|uniref:hypothetical protein n=1 Tax=Luteibacter sp. UNC138MFCol5.1 TaxID=1502774 RepID=UPI0008CCEAD1|nr:hypothetical protein [Luteibacter sp. UNC138MFCol5.1]SEO63176.1 hypothetical protein SAMN02800692_1503 [Luteibacter sp. UNC138MFCol5.1]